MFSLLPPLPPLFDPNCWTKSNNQIIIWLSSLLRTMVEMPQPQLKENHTLSCAFAVAGVMITLVIYGFLQVLPHVLSHFPCSVRNSIISWGKNLHRFCNSIASSSPYAGKDHGRWIWNRRQQGKVHIFYISCFL